MATVNGFTAAHMAAIEDNTIVSGAVVANHLILTRFDGTTIDVGNIVGLGVDGYITFPNTKIGQVLTTPEGVETDSPGGLRLSRAGQLWLKSTGTGNTGWIQVAAVPANNYYTITCTSSTRPGSPAAGQEIFETDTARRYVWNGTAWEYLSGGNPLYAARGYASSGVPLLTAGWGKILGTWAETYDYGSNFDTTNSKYVCPIAGLYEVRYCAGLQFNNTTQVYGVAVFKNGSQVTQGEVQTVRGAATGEGRSIVGTDLIPCAATDYLELYAYNGGANSIQPTPGSLSTFITVNKV